MTGELRHPWAILLCSFPLLGAIAFLRTPLVINRRNKSPFQHQTRAVSKAVSYLLPEDSSSSCANWFRITPEPCFLLSPCTSKAVTAALRLVAALCSLTCSLNSCSLAWCSFQVTKPALRWECCNLCPELPLSDTDGSPSLAPALCTPSTCWRCHRITASSFCPPSSRCAESSFDAHGGSCARSHAARQASLLRAAPAGI